MTIRIALPIAALALALSACSGGGSTENVTLSTDTAGIDDTAGVEENLVVDDLVVNDSGEIDTNATIRNLEKSANATDDTPASGTTNEL